MQKHRMQARAPPASMPAQSVGPILQSTEVVSQPCNLMVSAQWRDRATSSRHKLTRTQSRKDSASISRFCRTVFPLFAFPCFHSPFSRNGFQSRVVALYSTESVFALRWDSVSRASTNRRSSSYCSSKQAHLPGR